MGVDVLLRIAADRHSAEFTLHPEATPAEAAIHPSLKSGQNP